MVNGSTVCRSGVCDGDGKCGFANGDGPCTAGTSGTVCRSGVCDTDGNCGYANGDGPCTMVNGGTVCRSGMCSSNGTCEAVGGCNVDSDCPSAHWCNETMHVCMAQLPNGTALPSDAAHTSPTLNGMCTLAAGTLVCTSAVCDATDNKCGYANGDGPCTTANGGTVCRSAVCDPDNNCGYANGDGPCTMSNGSTVCRSGMCSSNGLCEPAGGCNVDADCSGGNWCNESMHTCTAKLANGIAMPTDAPHTNPTLNGTCASDAAMLVCVSGACDPADNKCGYANGDGPCTMANGGLVCRSGLCSHNDTCLPATGCYVNADCGNANLTCDPTKHVCSEAHQYGVSGGGLGVNCSMSGAPTSRPGLELLALALIVLRLATRQRRQRSRR
jgi:MYXO-CTERM domain-containing protein